MSTQAQIIANRRNARRSTGPLTARGKALASKNSLKHGLSAHQQVVSAESQADYDLHAAQILEELNPLTPMESMLADRVVCLSWRLKRAVRIQNQVIDALTEKDAANPLANLAKSLGLNGLAIPQLDPADSNPDLILGRIALKDFSNERVLDRLLMYERRIEHSLFKTLLELQRLRLLRSLEPSEPNLEPAASYLAAGPVPGGHHKARHPPQTAHKTTSTRPRGKIRKTNPISKTPKPPQPPMPQRVTTMFRSTQRKKTNPIEPKLVAA